MKPIQRLDQFRRTISKNIVDFERTIGYKTNAYSNALSRKSSLKDETITLVMKVYPQLNIEWLLLGGMRSMIKESENKLENSSFDEPNLHHIYELMSQIDSNHQHVNLTSKLKNEVVRLYSLYIELRNELQKIKKISDKL